MKIGDAQQKKKSKLKKIMSNEIRKIRETSLKNKIKIKYHDKI